MRFLRFFASICILFFEITISAESVFDSYLAHLSEDRLEQLSSYADSIIWMTPDSLTVEQQQIVQFYFAEFDTILLQVPIIKDIRDFHDIKNDCPTLSAEQKCRICQLLDGPIVMSLLLTAQVAPDAAIVQHEANLKKYESIRYGDTNYFHSIASQSLNPLCIDSIAAELDIPRSFTPAILLAAIKMCMIQSHLDRVERQMTNIMVYCMVMQTPETQQIMSLLGRICMMLNRNRYSTYSEYTAPFVSRVYSACEIVLQSRCQTMGTDTKALVGTMINTSKLTAWIGSLIDFLDVIERRKIASKPFAGKHPAFVGDQYEQDPNYIAYRIALTKLEYQSLCMVGLTNELESNIISFVGPMFDEFEPDPLYREQRMLSVIANDLAFARRHCTDAWIYDAAETIMAGLDYILNKQRGYDWFLLYETMCCAMDCAPPSGAENLSEVMLSLLDYDNENLMVDAPSQYAKYNFYALSEYHGEDATHRIKQFVERLTTLPILNESPDLYGGILILMCGRICYEEPQFYLKYYPEIKRLLRKYKSLRDYAAFAEMNYAIALRDDLNMLRIYKQLSKKEDFELFPKEISLLIEAAVRQKDVKDILILQQSMVNKCASMVHEMSLTSTFVREKQFAKLQQDIRSFYAAAAQTKDSDMQDKCAKAMYNVALYSKGIMLEATSQSESILKNHPDSSVQITYSNLSKYRSQYASDTINLARRMWLSYLISTAEKELTASVQRWAQNHPYQVVNTHMEEKFYACLTPHQYAIEFIHYPIDGDTEQYVALIATSKKMPVRLIPISNENELLEMSYRGSSLYTDTAVTDNIWRNIILQSGIQKGDTIYFAPEGILSQIAIEHLPISSTQCMSDVYSMHRMSSTRNLIDTTLQHSESGRAALYGGLQYDMQADDMTAIAEGYRSVQLFSEKDELIPVSTDTMRAMNLSKLVGTEKEIQSIQTLLSDPLVFRDQFGTEESFKSLSGRDIRILHIATHGFYRPLSKEELSSEDLLLRNELSMARSGLLMSGCGLAINQNISVPNVDDGILTAREISKLDLSHVDLVVLSACQTGKGTLLGDGVWGLQRGFKQAGVGTIIMSLWKVNDHTTQLLMTEFYRNWIERHQSKREAFRNAQDFVRNYKDEHGNYLYNKPYFWAGFVMLD